MTSFLLERAEGPNERGGKQASAISGHNALLVPGLGLHRVASGKDDLNS